MSVQLKIRINQPQMRASIDQPDLSAHISPPVVERYGGGDYERLSNLPMIEGVVLKGNKTFPQLNLQSLSNTELENLLTL